MKTQTLEDIVVILPIPTIKKFLSYGKSSGDLLALYLFYILTAKKQETNRIWCTRNFIKQGLSWPETKVQRTREILRDELKMIEEFPATGREGKSYVKINYITKAGTRMSILEGQLLFEGDSDEEIEFCSPQEEKKKISEEEKNELEEMFLYFYTIYPKSRRMSKTKNREKFISLLLKKGEINYRLFEEIVQGLETFIVTEWKEAIESNHKDKLQFIPHMSTWLNQKRWEGAKDLFVEEELNQELVNQLFQAWGNGQNINLSTFIRNRRSREYFQKAAEFAEEFYKKFDSSISDVEECIRYNYKNGKEIPEWMMGNTLFWNDTMRKFITEKK